MYKGIFWLTGGELLTVKVDCDESGMAHYRASVKNKNPLATSGGKI